MNDIISINRQFLIMAREAAKSTQAEIITGMPRNVLNKLALLTQEEIEKISKLGISLISMRLTESEIARLIKLDDTSQRTFYAISVLHQRDS